MSLGDLRYIIEVIVQIGMIDLHIAVNKNNLCESALHLCSSVVNLTWGNVECKSPNIREWY